MTAPQAISASGLLAHAAAPCSYTIAEAFAYCERMARTHYENFPVGSLLIPKSRRSHVCSIYAFARTADDFADEGYDTPLSSQDRLNALDAWQQQLEDCLHGKAQHPIFIALAETIRELRFPPEPFRHLLSAFRQDVIKQRYADFDEVLDYCQRSANPIGQLILLLFDYRDAHLHQLSDHICTALQLANFWQDVSVDLQKDRIYLPQHDLAKFNYSEADLQARRFNQQYASLLKFQVDRTRKIFEKGQALPRLVSGRLAYELRLTWLGGMRILERIEKQGYDTLSSRPEITKLDKVTLLLKAVRK